MSATHHGAEKPKRVRGRQDARAPKPGLLLERFDMRAAYARAIADVRGASQVEYLILLGVIALLALIGFQKFGVTTYSEITTIADHVSTLTEKKQGSDYCFVAGTLVATPDGLRPIEQIRVGDAVLSRDERDNEVVVKHATKIFITPDAALVEVRIHEPREAIRATPGHRFYTLDRGWVEAQSLASGEALLDAKGAPVHVESVLRLATRETVYNFEVEDTHTYFVGSALAWVHNPTDCNGNPIGGPPPANGTTSGGWFGGWFGGGTAPAPAPVANQNNPLFATLTNEIIQDSVVSNLNMGAYAFGPNYANTSPGLISLADQVLQQQGQPNGSGIVNINVVTMSGSGGPGTPNTYLISPVLNDLVPTSNLTSAQQQALTNALPPAPSNPIPAYYFPYLSGPVGPSATGGDHGMGYVDVPMHPGPNDPQFVITGAMNGCSMVVTQSEVAGHLRIYHYQSPDTNNLYVPTEHGGQGEPFPRPVVAWTTYADYGVTPSDGQNINGFNFMHYENGQWQLYSKPLNGGIPQPSPSGAVTFIPGQSTVPTAPGPHPINPNQVIPPPYPGVHFTP